MFIPHSFADLRDLLLSGLHFPLGVLFLGSHHHEFSFAGFATFWPPNNLPIFGSESVIIDVTIRREISYLTDVILERPPSPIRLSFSLIFMLFSCGDSETLHSETFKVVMGS